MYVLCRMQIYCFWALFSPEAVFGGLCAGRQPQAMLTIATDTNISEKTSKDSKGDENEGHRYICTLIIIDSCPRLSRDLAKLISSFLERPRLWCVTVGQNVRGPWFFDCKQDAEKHTRQKMFDWCTLALEEDPGPEEHWPDRLKEAMAAPVNSGLLLMTQVVEDEI